MGWAAMAANRQLGITACPCEEVGGPAALQQSMRGNGGMEA
jgi:hypothetical protein